MWQEWQSRQPLLFNTAVAHAALFLLCFSLALIDDTRITGINRWIKPMKFSLSIAIYLASMAWYWPIAIAPPKARQYAAWILASTLILEIVIIFGQAARGTRSHFNNETPMDAALFQVMGAAIVVNIITAAVVCRWTFRAEPSPYVWGIRLGLATFVVFAFEGLMMVRRLAHSVGVPDGGPGLPIVNWSTTGGDLRVAHFLGMHALQLLPVIGFVTNSGKAVGAAFAVWAALSITALIRALTGKPFP